MTVTLRYDGVIVYTVCCIQKLVINFYIDRERLTNMNLKVTLQQLLRERRQRSQFYTCEHWRSLKQCQLVKWFSGLADCLLFVCCF